MYREKLLRSTVLWTRGNTAEVSFAVEYVLVNLAWIFKEVYTLVISKIVLSVSVASQR